MIASGVTGHTGAVAIPGGAVSRWVTTAAIAAIAWSAPGCGPDVDATDYGAENRAAFLAACTIPGEDPRLVRDVCECTYERIEADMAFDDFVSMEESLLLDALAPLPESVAGYMADCFVDVVDL